MGLPGACCGDLFVTVVSWWFSGVEASLSWTFSCELCLSSVFSFRLWVLV